MPCTIIPSSQSPTTPSTSGSTLGTFTGTVFLDRLHGETGSISIVNVNFSPGARTYWHTHSGGQLLRVLAGSGWVCDKGESPRKINHGDLIWCPPGTTHWHGADDGSYMVHQAVSHGKVEWLEAVEDQEYNAKAKA